MMLAIRVEFLHGVLRAGSAEDLAMTGQGDPGEWPPSPARLFSALVAADGTGARSAVTDGSELVVLESAPPPSVIADSPGNVLRSQLRPRFVVVDARSEGVVQQYPARRAELVRPASRLAPLVPEVTYIWPGLAPSPSQIDALKRRAARVSYLGCSDSPVRVSVTLEAPDHAGERTWLPDSAGSRSMPVPYEGLTQALDSAFERWLEGPTRRAWLRTVRARYSPPGERPERIERPSVFWLVFGSSVPGRAVLDVTQTLRAAVLDLYQRSLGDGELPAVLHGHGYRGSGLNHASWLALPDVGFKYSTGRIHGAAVWMPPNTEPDVIARLRAALSALNQLVRPGRFDVPVTSYGGEARPTAAVPDRWVGPSRRWVSAFPVVHERWTSRGPAAQEIQRWFAHAGVRCEVISYRTSTVPLLTGALRLRPHEVHRDGHEAHPYSFVEVEIDREIEGPVAIGGARQFGLGLMLPRE